MLQTYKKTLFAWLQTAIELEHSTIPPYLAGMFTITEDNNPDSYFLIRSVVMEEMLHMTLASNVLNAVGGHPYVDNPSFIPEYPVEMNFKGREFPVSLEKFSPNMIETALKIEEPEEDLGMPDTVATYLKGIQAPAADARMVVVEGDSEIDVPALTIGQFYNMVIEMLKRLCEVFGEENVFDGNPALQIQPEHYYGSGGKITVVTDLATATEAINTIVEQGEGAPPDFIVNESMDFEDREELGHYYKFNEIKHGRYYQRGDHPDNPTGKLLPVDYGAALPMLKDPKEADFEAGSELWEAARDFNVIYSTLLHHLHDAFNGQQERMRQAVVTMYELKYSALALLNVPLPDQPDVHAGPPFQYVVEENRVLARQKGMSKGNPS